MALMWIGSSNTEKSEYFGRDCKKKRISVLYILWFQTYPVENVTATFFDIYTVWQLHSVTAKEYDSYRVWLLQV
jgi:hypothetical protein